MNSRTVIEKIAQTKDFSHFQLVRATQPNHTGASPTIRADFIDMGIVRDLNPHDRIGYRQLIKGIKTHILGDPHLRISQNRSEKFFGTPSYFHNFFTD